MAAGRASAGWSRGRRSSEIRSMAVMAGQLAPQMAFGLRF
jgi:hypothetical protein